MSTTTTVSEMSFIVSNVEGPHEFSPHGKHSLVMNGSPRTSTHHQRHTSIDTTNINSGSFISNGTIFSSPTHDPKDGPPVNRISSEATSHTYPPSTHIDSQYPGDLSLRVPKAEHAANRRSSPARFPSADASIPNRTSSIPSASDSSLRSPSTPRLQHRHTLEVPRVAPSSTQKDFAPRDSEETPNGRLSSSLAGHRHRRGSLSLGRRISRSYNSDLHLDGSTEDEEVSRRAEAIRQKRASKRRRREEDDDDRVIVGTKVDQHHVNWVTAYNMLTGIRFTVSRTNAKLDRSLTDEDFEAQHKFSFDITGNEITPGVKYDFKFKDYAPWVFRHLREIFNIDPADYLISLTGKYILSELGSPGKSGSFFYFSRDYKYIIKTIHHSEHVLLRQVLKQYYNHVSKNRNTLLSQFYGLHRVKTPWSGKKIHFVVMNNLFPPHRDIHRTFDLKGSLIGRDFKEEDIEHKPRAVLKDLNWLRRNMHLELGPQKKHAFLEQMKQDVELLKKLNIMDYSLLVGIHDLQKGNEERLRDKTLQVFQPGGEEENNQEVQRPEQLARTPSTLETARKAKELRSMIIKQRPVPMGSTSSRMPDEMPDELIAERRDRYFYSDDGGFSATHQDDTPGEAVYYLGIIDCLTKYSTVKKTEHFFKGLAARSRKGDISAVPPDRYGNRFIKFMSGITMSKEAATDMESEKYSQLPPEKRSEEKAKEELDVGADRTRAAVQTDGPATLPVVEEAPEASSTGGRSAHSSRSKRRGGEPEEEKWERSVQRGEGDVGTTSGELP